MGEALHVALDAGRHTGLLVRWPCRFGWLIACGAFDQGLVEHFGVVVKVPEPRLLGAERRVSASSDGLDECPDHVHKRVVVREDLADALASRVRHIDAAVFIRGLAAGQGAVDARPTRRLEVSELATAARTLRGKLHGAADAGRAVKTPLPRLVQFADAGGFVWAKLAEEHDQASLNRPLPRSFEVVALDGEEPVEYLVVQGGYRCRNFEEFGFVAGFECGEPSLLAGVEVRLVGVVAFAGHVLPYVYFVTDVSGESLICKTRVLSVRNDLGAEFRTSCGQACTCPSWLAR